MLTEQQARETICPHLPADIEVEPVNNIVAHRVTRFPQCWASKCSQWRWQMEPIHGDAGAHRGWKQSDKGFCGLAGMPIA
jgi:hypothetical protein